MSTVAFASPLPLRPMNDSLRSRRAPTTPVAWLRVVRCSAGAGSAQGSSAWAPTSIFLSCQQEIESTQRFNKVAASLERSCGINSASELMCWGTGYAGSFGNGEDNTPYFSPVKIAMPEGVAVKAVAPRAIHLL